MAKKILLKSCDGEILEIAEDAAKLSTILRYTMKDAKIQTTIPVPIHSRILAKVIEYCTKHAELQSCMDFESAEDDVDDCTLCDREVVRCMIRKFDDKFMKFDIETVVQITTAGHFLEINCPKNLGFPCNLENLGCKTLAKIMDGRTADEIRTLFGIKKDYTPEEEEALRKLND